MGDLTVNLGEFSKPATVLIEKISDAVGGYFRPYQIKRVAKAEAEADKIRAVAKIEIDVLQERALRRFIAEEARNQKNIETIGSSALPLLEEDATPEDIQDDWIINFFDKCRLISDGEMQQLWSRVLAGEANSPGNFSKRTVNALSSLDKHEAQLFSTVCGFGFDLGGLYPLIYKHTGEMPSDIYLNNGLRYFDLEHLDAIGLIRFDVLSGFDVDDMPKNFQAS